MISSDEDEKTLRPPLCFARPLSRLGRAQTRLVLLIPAIAPARTCSLAIARTRSLSLNRCFISRLIRNSLKSRIYYSVSRAKVRFFLQFEYGNLIFFMHMGLHRGSGARLCRFARRRTMCNYTIVLIHCVKQFRIVFLRQKPP